MSPISQLASKDFILQNIDVSKMSVGSEGRPIVLLIKAEWCGFCQRYLPEFENLSQQYKKIKFCTLEQTQNETMLAKHWPALANPAFQVNGYPTVVYYDAEGNPSRVVDDRSKIKDDLKKMA